MTQEMSPRQRELAAAAVAAGERLRREADVSARPAEVGDLFVLEETFDFPLEWALLERRDPSGLFLSVPGDSYPFLGSRDVQVETSTGLLNLRCGAVALLEPARLKLDLRVGVLQPDSLEQARARAREVSQKGFAPDPFLEDVDLSPEYEDWMQSSVFPARDAAGSPAAVLPFKPAAAQRQRNPLLPWLVLAAAMFLLTCVGLSAWVLRQHRQIEGLAAQSRSYEKALLVERAQRIGEWHKTSESWKAREKQLQELQGKLGFLEKSQRETVEQPLLNSPVAILQPAEIMRGTDLKSYPLPAAAPSLTIVLKFPEAEPYSAYRLILTKLGSTEALWKTDGLERSPEGVQLTLPRRYLPPGKYRLSLSGLDSEKARPVADYELLITP